MNFYKTIGYTSIYTAINMLASLLITKVTAKLLGPEGTAMMGQFSNAVAALTILASAAIGTGVVKYISENKNNKVEFEKYIATAFGITFFCSGIITIFVVCFHKWLGVKAFSSHEFDLIFLLYGISLVLNTTNLLLGQILNGLAEIKKLTTVNIITSVANLVLTITFAIKFGIWGALLASVAVSCTGFFFMLLLIRKMDWFRRKILFGGIDFKIARQYSEFSLMSVVFLISPFVLIIIRDFLTKNLSLEQAGLWQGMMKISDTYLNFIVSILTVYYVPRFSEIHDTNELVIEMRKGFKRIMPLVIVLSFSIWLCRDLIISLLLSPKFVPMRDLFALNLLGDVFKVAGYLFVYVLVAPMFAHKITKANITTMITYQIVLLGSNLFFVKKFGLIGTSYACLLTMVVYLFTAMYFTRQLVVATKKSIAPNSLKQNFKNFLKK